MAEVIKAVNHELAYIGLGSNVGDRENYLHEAIRLMREHTAIVVKSISSVYETDPVGYLDQPDFLNIVISIETALTAHQLFQIMSHIEQSLGRIREIINGPRTIDLDLLIFGKKKCNAPELTVPHPRMMERPFVLIPLLEIIDRGQKELSTTLSNQLAKLSGKEGVKLWKKVQWLSE